jgi:hypothetical protein
MSLFDDLVTPMLQDDGPEEPNDPGPDPDQIAQAIAGAINGDGGPAPADLGNGQQGQELPFIQSEPFGSPPTSTMTPPVTVTGGNWGTTPDTFGDAAKDWRTGPLPSEVMAAQGPPIARNMGGDFGDLARGLLAPMSREANDPNIRAGMEKMTGIDAVSRPFGKYAFDEQDLLNQMDKTAERIYPQETPQGLMAVRSSMGNFETKPISGGAMGYNPETAGGGQPLWRTKDNTFYNRTGDTVGTRVSTEDAMRRPGGGLPARQMGNFNQGPGGGETEAQKRARLEQERLGRVRATQLDANQRNDFYNTIVQNDPTLANSQTRPYVVNPDADLTYRGIGAKTVTFAQPFDVYDDSGKKLGTIQAGTRGQPDGDRLLVQDTSGNPVWIDGKTRRVLPG